MIDECIKYVNEETSFPANCFQPVELQVAITNYGDYGVIPDSVTGSTWFRFLKHCKLDVCPQHASKTQISESAPVIVKSNSTYSMFGKRLNGALSLQISPKKVQATFKALSPENYLIPMTARYFNTAYTDWVQYSNMIQTILKKPFSSSTAEAVQAHDSIVLGGNHSLTAEYNVWQGDYYAAEDGMFLSEKPAKTLTLDDVTETLESVKEGDF
jgi:hypothetical protein